MQQPRAPVTQDDVLLNCVRRQVESHLSPGSIQRDFVVQQYLSAYNGFFPVHMLAQYPGIQQIYHSAGTPTEPIQSLILRALENSRLVTSTECGHYVYPTGSKPGHPSNMNPYRTVVSPDHSEIGSVCMNNAESYKGKDSSTQATAPTASASGSPTSFISADSMMSQDGYLLPGFFPPIYNFAYGNPAVPTPLARPVPKQPPSVIYQPQYAVPGTSSPLNVPPNTPIKQTPIPSQHYTAAHPYAVTSPGNVSSPVPFATRHAGYSPASVHHQVHAAGHAQQQQFQMSTMAAPYMMQPPVNTPYPTAPTVLYPDYSQVEFGHHHPGTMMENHHDGSTVGSSVATDHHNPFVPPPTPPTMANYYEHPAPPTSPTKPYFKNHRGNKGQRNNKQNSRGGSNRRNKNNQNFPKRGGAGACNNNEERSSPTSPPHGATSPTEDPLTNSNSTAEHKPYLAAALHPPGKVAAAPKEAVVTVEAQEADNTAGAEALEHQMKKLSVEE